MGYRLSTPIAAPEVTIDVSESRKVKSAISHLSWHQLLLASLSLFLLWPAVLNGSPFLFPDTTAYIRSVDTVVLHVFDHATEWSNSDVYKMADTGLPADRNAKVPQINAENAYTTDKPVLLGRSIFYGVIAYLGVILGSLWITIIFQVLFVGLVMIGFLRLFVDPFEKQSFAIAYIVVIGVLATTPLAFYSSMVMPDVFAGTTILAATALATSWERETRLARVLWTSVASYGALVHSSHVLILIIVATSALLVCWRPKLVSRAGTLAIFLAASVGVGGDALFSTAVRLSTGDAPIRPPFITARLIDDGPGMSYLQEYCRQPAFVLCRYRDRLPLSSDDFLWRSDKTGVFKAVPASEQRALAAEQTRFVMAVLVDRPSDVARSTVAAIKTQALLWQLPEFDQSSAGSRSIAAKLPPKVRATFIASEAYRGTMPTNFINTVVPIWFLIGIAALATSIYSSASRYPREMIFLTIGWASNVLICGALSTPHDRYQARVIWIFALIALIGAIRHRSWFTTRRPMDRNLHDAAA